MFRKLRNVMLKPIISMFVWRSKDNEDDRNDSEYSNDNSLQEKLIDIGTIKIVLFQ